MVLLPFFFFFLRVNKLLSTCHLGVIFARWSAEVSFPSLYLKIQHGIWVLGKLFSLTLKLCGTGKWKALPVPSTQDQYSCHGNLVLCSNSTWSDLRKFCDLAEKAGKWFGVSKCCLYIYFSILVAFLRKATLSHTWNTAVGTAQQLSVLQLCFKCYDTSWGKRFEKEMLFVYVKIESRRPKCFAVSALRSSVKRWYPIAVCLFQPGTETICLK